MAVNDSIINHRNMQAIYTGWFIALLLVFSIVYLAYAIQFDTPYMTFKSSATWITFTALAGVAWVLAILFKLLFRREYIAWAFCVFIAISGLVCFLVYGWTLLFGIFFLVAIATLFILGPYLYYE